MDLIQLYSATSRVVTSLKTSGLMPALKNYRASLRGKAQADRATIEKVLLQASGAYVQKSAMYGEHENIVVNLLHLNELGHESFWTDLTSSARSIEARLAQSVAAFSKVMFATGHLPGLLALAREASAVDGLRTDEPDSGTLVLRMYDAVEPASSPDRISRLIDAIDILYSVCAAMSGAAPDSLRLMSVSGVAVRSVIFHGDQQTVNALAQVVAELTHAAELQQNSTVEEIASEMSLLGAIDELERLNVMSSEVAVVKRRDAQEGAIMLLEGGAQLVDLNSASDGGYIPAAVIARIDADGKAFDSIDSKIVGSIDAMYDEVYEREKLRLVNEPVDLQQQGAAESGSATANKHSIQNSNARGERSASKPVVAKPVMETRKDSIDELIMDLNRFYGEQR